MPSEEHFAFNASNKVVHSQGKILGAFCAFKSKLLVLSVESDPSGDTSTEKPKEVYTKNAFLTYIIFLQCS